MKNLVNKLLYMLTNNPEVDSDSPTQIYMFMLEHTPIEALEYDHR
jgi:hypothetical protein